MGPKFMVQKLKSSMQKKNKHIRERERERERERDNRLKSLHLTLRIGVRRIVPLELKKIRYL